MVLSLTLAASCGTFQPIVQATYDASSGEVRVHRSAPLSSNVHVSGFSPSGDLLYTGKLQDTTRVGLWKYYEKELLVARVKYDEHGNVLMSENSNFGQMYSR